MRRRYGRIVEIALFILPFAAFWILLRLGDARFIGARNYLNLARAPLIVGIGLVLALFVFAHRGRRSCYRRSRR